MLKDLRCGQVDFYIIPTQNANVTQRGTGRGPAYNLFGYGARRPDGQVSFSFSWIIGVFE